MLIFFIAESWIWDDGYHSDVCALSMEQEHIGDDVHYFKVTGTVTKHPQKKLFSNLAVALCYLQYYIAQSDKNFICRLLSYFIDVPFSWQAWSQLYFLHLRC